MVLYQALRHFNLLWKTILLDGKYVALINCGTNYGTILKKPEQ